MVVTPVLSDHEGIRTVWVLFSVFMLKFPLVALLWWFIVRNKEWPVRPPVWSERETGDILTYLLAEADRVVTGGTVTLDEPASSVQIGLPYTHIIEPLPPTAVDGSYGRAVRLIEAVYKLDNTAAFRLDSGRGPRDVPLRQFGAGVLDSPPAPFSGDIRIRAFGWQAPTNAPLWRIEQSIPLPFTLLSVTTELSVNS